jgi:hypothetical protein
MGQNWPDAIESGSATRYDGQAHPSTWAGLHSASVGQPNRSARPGYTCAVRTEGGDPAPGAGGGAVHGGSPVDEVWRRWWAKLELEGREAPSIFREAQAHRSGDATWGCGGAVARQNFKAVADLRPSLVASRCSYITEGRRGA